MSGRKITKQQIRIYMQSRKTRKTQKVAAAQAGFSERSAYNIQNRGFIEAKANRSWKTRKDPFKSVCESEVILMLEASLFTAM